MKYAMEQRLRAGRLREQQCNRSAAAVTNNPFRGCSRVSVRHGSLSAGCSRSGSGGRNVAVAQDVRRHDRQDVPHVQIARELGVDRGAVTK